MSQPHQSKNTNAFFLQAGLSFGVALLTMIFAICYLPVDPWIRVHVRAGGRIAKVAPRSMVVPGTLEEWREWTGLPFEATGPVVVPRALTPVHCDVEHGVATYVEPNVWVVHRTGR